MKKRQMTLQMRLDSLHKPNKHELTFKLDPRAKFYQLKFGWIAFKKPKKYLVIETTKNPTVRRF